MNSETFGRALLLWEPWNHSVAETRQTLGYNLDWSDRERTDWINANHLKVRKRAKQELDCLRLPPNTWEFYEDCCYCDYHTDLGPELISVTRAFGYFDRGEFRLGNPSLPKPPWDSAAVWLPQEDVTHPWLRLEIRIDAQHYTSVLFEDVMNHTRGMLEDLIAIQGIKKHPLSGLINRAKARPPDLGRKRIEIWERTKDTHDYLKDLWSLPETQSSLADALREYSNKHERDSAVRRFRDRFRGTSLRYLRNRGFDVERPRSSWWE
jgi:hypothetical protein